MLQHTQILVFIIVCVNDIIIISPLFLLGKADDTLNGEQDREQNEQKFCSVMHPKLLPDSIGRGGIVLKDKTWVMSVP